MERGVGTSAPFSPIRLRFDKIATRATRPPMSERVPRSTYYGRFCTSPLVSIRLIAKLSCRELTALRNFIARGWGFFALTMRKNVIHGAMLVKRGNFRSRQAWLTRDPHTRHDMFHHLSLSYACLNRSIIQD